LEHAAAWPQQGIGEAAIRIADFIPQVMVAQFSLYPALPRIREVSAQIAAATVGAAYESGIAGRIAAASALPDIEKQMYEPHQQLK